MARVAVEVGEVVVNVVAVNVVAVILVNTVAMVTNVTTVAAVAVLDVVGIVDAAVKMAAVMEAAVAVRSSDGRSGMYSGGRSGICGGNIGGGGSNSDRRGDVAVAVVRWW